MVDHLVDLYRTTEALDVDLAHVTAHDQVLDQRVGLVGDEDLTFAGSTFQAAGEVHFAADDGVVHACIGAKVADRTVAGVDAHANFQWLGDALGPPLLAQYFHVFAHGNGHRYGIQRILLGTLAGGIAEEHHHAVADKLV